MVGKNSIIPVLTRNNKKQPVNDIHSIPVGEGCLKSILSLHGHLLCGNLKNVWEMLATTLYEQKLNCSRFSCVINMAGQAVTATHVVADNPRLLYKR